GLSWTSARFGKGCSHLSRSSKTPKSDLLRDMPVRGSLLRHSLDTRPAGTLYHYTSGSGFMGIVKDRCIHLTHSQYLNDREECLLAVNKVRHDIETRQERASNSQDLYEAMLEDVPGDGFYTNVCVGSFSAANDSLPQWRAY